MTPRHLLAAAALLLFALDLACAQAQPQTPNRPAGYGSLATHPVPAGAGGPGELDFCYRYSKRLWELTRGQPKDDATRQKLEAVIRQALSPEGAREDAADVGKYFAGTYKTNSAMAAARFYTCGAHLKLPIAPRHQASAELCFDGLTLPRVAADARAAGKSEEDELRDLRAGTPAKTHQLVEQAVRLVYQAKSDTEVEATIRKVFFTCFASLGDKPAKDGPARN
ncbi:MAG TPA: hypothetical protein VGN52_25660 [Burkholderiales bacterium]